MSELYSQLQHVCDPKSFARFAAALRQEVHENAEKSGPFQAESYDLGSALEAVEHWSSTQEKVDTIITDNPWRAAARILLIGHYYE